MTNDELNKLCDWFKVNKLSVNAKKTNYILFGHKQLPDNNSYHLTLDGNCLERVRATKFLGLYIDEKLTWNHHINYVCIKISKGLGIIRRLKSIFPSSVLLTLYNSLIYPYLCYCCIIWGNAYSCTLNSLEVLQNRAIRIITNSYFRASAGPLFHRLNLLRITDIHKFQTLIFMYQAKHNILPHSCMRYFVVNLKNTYNMRCISYFKLSAYRTNIRKNSIGIKGPEMWTTIPVVIQDSVTISVFKTLLKCWLINNHNDV